MQAVESKGGRVKVFQLSEVQQLLRDFFPKYRKRGGKLKWDDFLAQYGITQPVRTTFAGALKMGGELGERIAEDIRKAEDQQLQYSLEVANAGSGE